MTSIGFLLHPENDRAVDVARELIDWLMSRGHEVRLVPSDAHRCDLPHLGVPEAEIAIGLDLFVGLGGDGTMLRAVQLVSDDGIAVLGVNLGQLGYLAPIEPDGARVALKRFLAGDVRYEERMRIAIAVHRVSGETEHSAVALNEAILERSSLGHTVRIGVELDRNEFTSYVADGLIVATPTGSTAYAFSARGPIVDPRYKALVVVPVSPHMLFDRALVLDPTTSVRMVVQGARAAHLSVDGQSVGVLDPGDAVVCSVAERPARFARIGDLSFHEILTAKFGLAQR